MSMTATSAARLTFGEFERLPDGPGKQELLRGELIEMPPPKLKHNEIAERVYQRLIEVLDAARGRGQGDFLGKVHHEMGYRVGDGWLRPDVSITHAAQPADDYYQGSPALAVEVISNDTTADRIDAKIGEYLDHGALEVWVLYPERRHVWIFRRGHAEMCAGTFAAEMLGGGTIDLEDILR